MKKIITTLPDPPWDDSVTHNLEIRDMTHEEKAKELVEKFISNQRETLAYGYNQLAKQNALMVADEIILNNRELLESQLNNDFSIMDNSNNWRLIKAEIEKL